MTLTVATWNINSVRLRLPLLARLAEEARPDVVCLQETKVTDDLFPSAAIADLGYPHQIFHGMKGYNGVAILSRRKLEGTGTRGWCGKADCRHAFAILPGGIELHNFYVPAGGDVPDPRANPKFAHKLRFLREIADWWATSATKSARCILVGDLNVAPLPNDVWSHKQLLDVVSHTPVEVKLLGRLQAAHGWVDAIRHFVPAEEKLYSWWSYRARDWRKSDRGRRLDHVWVTPALTKALGEMCILKDARSWPTPSDHVPVLMALSV